MQLYSGSVGNSTAISLSQSYLNFDYLGFVSGHGSYQNLPNSGDADKLTILSLEEFEFAVKISALLGEAINISSLVTVDGNRSPYGTQTAINAKYSHTSTYWSAGFYQSGFYYGSNYNLSPNSIFGIRKN